eukprot:scaffold717_cov133-Chaetoceros_neogracile.AAC.1
MGACTSCNTASASIIVSAGPDTLHACFMVCLKMDLYHSKYANMPITYSVKPCPPGKGYVDNTYGEGTVFSGFNAMGRPEKSVVTEVVPLEKVVMTSADGAATMTHTMTALPGDKCRLELEMKCLFAGGFKAHAAMQVNTMKHFIEANVGPICNDAPPIGRQFGKITESFKAALTTKPTAFCGNCGKASSKDAFCGGCGVPNGGAATGGDPPREGF